MKILCRRGKFKDTEKIIRNHPFGIGIGADTVFVFRYLKVPPVVPKYRNTEFHSVFPALPLTRARPVLRNFRGRLGAPNLAGGS